MSTDESRQSSPDQDVDFKICWMSGKTWVELSSVGATLSAVGCGVLIWYHLKDPVEYSVCMPFALILFVCWVLWILVGVLSKVNRSFLRRDFARRNTALREHVRSATYRIRHFSLWDYLQHQWRAMMRSARGRRNSGVPAPVETSVESISGSLEFSGRERPVVVWGFEEPRTPIRTRRENLGERPNVPHMD